MFGGKGFQVTDEIYQFNRGVYSREKQRVILSLDYKTMQASTAIQRIDELLFVTKAILTQRALRKES